MILDLRATPEDVMRAVEALQEFARAKQLEEKDIFGLALALEECGSNVVNHALRRDPQQKFRVTIEHLDGTVTIELRDRGPAFDPTRAPMAESVEAHEDRPPGGWGIQLVRRYMDEIHYRRESGENVLRLVKRATPSGNDECQMTNDEGMPNGE
jgi:anti-sigma regulatory factor (Ser/Thr protein kinase)